MDSMKDVLEQQDTIAARVKLIESQIEGFKVQSVSTLNHSSETSNCYDLGCHASALKG